MGVMGNGHTVSFTLCFNTIYSILYTVYQPSKCEGILVGCKQTPQRQRHQASDLERIACQLAFATMLCANWVAQWIVQWTSLRVHSFQPDHRSLKEKTEDHLVSPLFHLSDPLLLTESPHRAQAAHRHLYQHPILATAATLTRIHLFTWPHFARSGWVRAAWGSSCSGSDQKRGRDFFDYSVFVRLPLKLSHSQGPLSEWAVSQDTQQKICGVEISSHLFLIKNSLFIA